MPFRPFGLHAGILKAIDFAEYPQPTPIQVAAVPKILAGADVIGIAQTGTGKTAAFLWPLLHRLASDSTHDPKSRCIRALIIVPTRELAIQIVANVRSYGKHLAIRTIAIHGGVDDRSQSKALRRGVDIMVATPGRLLDLTDKLPADFSRLSTLILDEADRMLDMGFRSDIETLVARLPTRRQTLMFSATLSKEVESLARRFQRRPQIIQIGKRADPAASVVQSVYEVPTRLKAALLLDLVHQPAFQRVLVFVRLKDSADRLTEFLLKQGFTAARLHSRRSQDQRSGALEDFKAGRVQILVATDLAARGIDIDDISHVINFDFPLHPEDYIHRIGRTGRAAASGEAISLVAPEDQNLLHQLEMFIVQRLQRKHLKHFDYRAGGNNPMTIALKRDWRKRTRVQSSPPRAAQAKKPGHPRSRPSS